MFCSFTDKKTQKMKIVFTTFLLLIFTANLVAQENLLLTFYEKSGFRKTPGYAETLAFCKTLDEASEIVKYTNFGVSPEGRELPLLIADKNQNFTPESVKLSGNSLLLIQACIHPGESDGKDAGLMLLRDIISKKEYQKLLDHVTVLFIPIFNTDGHERFGPYNRINQNGPDEMGWRTTAQNLNLNRDFMKADAPEMQAWLKMFNHWLPDFFVDCHTTDGADFQYTMTYALETLGNMEKNLSDWTKNTCENYLVSEMEKSGYPIFPYVQFRNWHDPRSGMVMGVAPPMLSQGYCAIQNRPGLLIETHMLKPYKTRVSSTYIMLQHTLQLLNDEYKNLHQLIKQADIYSSGDDFRAVNFPVKFAESMADSAQIEFKGYEYRIDTSDLTGGLWFKYDNSKPTNWQITIFPTNIPSKNVSLPEAYIIPPQCTEVIERLKLHGIQMQKLNENINITVRRSMFSNVRWQSRSTEGRQKLSYELSDTVLLTSFPSGTVLVDMNQRTARVIAHLLEPASPDSYAAWGFFDAYLEQKEYSESYVMETMAREMIEKNPALKTEFEAKKATDKAFAADTFAMLNWFYSKTPYWDNRFNVYPIGRITDRETVKNLKHK